VICQRTALINQARGLLAEYGIVLSKGPARLAAEGPDAVAAAPLSDLARELFVTLFDQLQELETRVEALDARLVAICREDAASRCLATLPGVGPVIATALVASVNDGRHFRNGRELAAPRRPPGRRPFRNEWSEGHSSDLCRRHRQEAAKGIDRCCDRWIGLVPRQHGTGGKPKLGGIGRQANHYLRRQMGTLHGVPHGRA
jgi:transposase